MLFNRNILDTEFFCPMSQMTKVQNFALISIVLKVQALLE